MSVRRTIAWIIDLYIAAFIVIVPHFFWELAPWISPSCGVLLMCLKDISGKSVGKRIMKLEVTDLLSVPKTFRRRLILRNVTTIFWPLEVLYLLIKKDEQRIGDLWAYTKVAEKVSL